MKDWKDKLREDDTRKSGMIFSDNITEKDFKCANCDFECNTIDALSWHKSECKGIRKSKGFYINFTGDESVGILPAQWQITGDFEFENENELNQFKQKLKEAWEYCSDTPIGVETFEERQIEIKKQYANTNGEF